MYDLHDSVGDAVVGLPLALRYKVYPGMGEKQLLNDPSDEESDGCEAGCEIFGDVDDEIGDGVILEVDEDEKDEKSGEGSAVADRDVKYFDTDPLHRFITGISDAPKGDAYHLVVKGGLGRILAADYTVLPVEVVENSAMDAGVAGGFMWGSSSSSSSSSSNNVGGNSSSSGSSSSSSSCVGPAAVSEPASSSKSGKKKVRKL